MTKKKITKVQEAYKKERRRIQNYLSKKFKQGFYTTQKILPAEPKKVTEASVNRLKKITAKDIVKKLRFVMSEETGETTSGSRGVEILRSEAAKKAAKTRKEKKKAEAEFFGVDYVNIDEVAIDVLENEMNILRDMSEETYFKNDKGKWVMHPFAARVASTGAKEAYGLYHANLERYGKDYVKWIEKHKEKISDAITNLMKSSNQEVLEYSVSTLISALDYTGNFLNNYKE